MVYIYIYIYLFIYPKKQKQEHSTTNIAEAPEAPQEHRVEDDHGGTQGDPQSGKKWKAKAGKWVKTKGFKQENGSKPKGFLGFSKGFLGNSKGFLGFSKGVLGFSKGFLGFSKVFF